MEVVEYHKVKNLYILEVLLKGEKEKMAESLFKEIIIENIPNLEKEIHVRSLYPKEPLID